VISALLVAFTITSVFFIFKGSNINSGVVNQMEEHRLRTAGTITFISKVESARREAEGYYKMGYYKLAYHTYKDAYALGSLDKKVYLGLVNTCQKLCEDNNSYCAEISEWQMVFDRLK
ncbi:MAG: hypothetical protein AAFQ37_02350, partial [Bacteroidota bacterium]